MAPAGRITPTATLNLIKSSLCDYRDACMLVKGAITITVTPQMLLNKINEQRKEIKE